jgi:hypothetical protein
MGFYAMAGNIDGLLRSLRNIARDFRDARYQGKKSFKLWIDLSDDCEVILQELWREGYLRSIGPLVDPASIVVEIKNADPDTLYTNLVHRLIGFDEVVFDSSHPVLRMLGQVDVLGAKLIASGLVKQEPIMASYPGIGSGFNPNLPSAAYYIGGRELIGSKWEEYGFEILGRYAVGCEIIAEVIEQEIASGNCNQAASDGCRPEDGLYDENRRLVWGGVQFTLTTNQAMVFELLVDAYPSDVLLSRFEDIGIGALRDSFRRKNTKGKKEFEPVWYLIDRGSRKDSKRMLDPAKVKTDSRFISAYPT